MKRSFRSFPKGGMGFPAVFTEVGRGQEGPDVRTLSLLFSSPQSFSLLCFCPALPMLVVNPGQKRLWEKVCSKRPRNPGAAPRGFSLGERMATPHTHLALPTLPPQCSALRKASGMSCSPGASSATGVLAAAVSAFPPATHRSVVHFFCLESVSRCPSNPGRCLPPSY